MSCRCAHLNHFTVSVKSIKCPDFNASDAGLPDRIIHSISMAPKRGQGSSAKEHLRILFDDKIGPSPSLKIPVYCLYTGALVRVYGLGTGDCTWAQVEEVVRHHRVLVLILD